MELRHLRYYVAVAEELHFGRAAARLGIAQPPLSQQIRRLEDELGVLLLRRTRRRVELTEAGRVFLEEARRTLAQAEQAMRAAQRAQRGEIGRLDIGYVGSAAYDALPEALRAFRDRFPDVELGLHELSTAQQAQALHERRLDVGFLRPPLYDAALVHEVIVREPLVVALPATHPLASQRRIPLRALATEPFILYPRSVAPGPYDQLMSLCRAAGFSPRVTQEAVEMQTIAGLVAAGIGVALVVATVQDLRSGGVVYRALADAAPTMDLALAWCADDPSRVLAAFRAVAADRAEA